MGRQSDRERHIQLLLTGQAVTNPEGSRSPGIRHESAISRHLSETVVHQLHRRSYAMIFPVSHM